MKSSVSIALFFLLSGFFLAVLLSALERSRKLLAIAGACLAAIVVIIVLLTPVELPSWHLGKSGASKSITSSTTAGTSPTAAVTVTTTTVAIKTTLVLPPSSTSLGQARPSVTTATVTTSLGGTSVFY